MTYGPHLTELPYPDHISKDIATVWANDYDESWRQLVRERYPVLYRNILTILAKGMNQ